jgi:hypothetical protein
MDSHLLIVILAILLLISGIMNFFIFVAWNRMRKREKARRERIDQEGTPVAARVTQVIHQKEKRKFVVYAQWYSRETGKVYDFQNTYRFWRGALKFRPKIQRGDVVQVNVIFNEYLYRIKSK